MGPDDFALGQPAPQPFDFGSVYTPPFVTPGGQAPQPTGQPQKHGVLGNPQDRMQAMKLAIMLPLALKAGPGAVQGLLQGFNAHEQAQYTRGRQQQADSFAMQQNQRAQASQDWQQQYQQGTLDNQRETQRRQFLNDFATRVGTLDDPASIDALSQLYGSQAQALGIDPAALKGYAQQAANPTKLQQRAAEKAVAKLRSEYGEKWLEVGAQFTHRLPGSDQPVSFDQLLKMAGQERDPNAPASTTSKPETRSIEVQAADALARGDTETYNRLLKVHRDVGLANDKPGDPLTEAIKQARLQQILQGGNLSPRTQQQVQSQARAFDQLPVVKNTQTIAEAAQFVQGLDPNTKNPNDDQALIYAFAKAMDPNSVVREGEYATVQKYSQSWLQSMGFNAARILTNTEFLTPQSRLNMKRTILQKFRAAQGQYSAVRNSFVSKINKMTGGQDGADYLTGYETAFPQDETAAPAPVSVQPPANRGGAAPVAPGANPFRRTP